MNSTNQLTFKAVRFNQGSDPLRLTETSLPVTKTNGSYAVKDTEILVKVKAAALNPIDIILYKFTGRLVNWLTGCEHGFGRDFSGVIEEIGPEAMKESNFKKGDRVCGLIEQFFRQGSLSEYLLLDYKTEKTIVKVPEAVSLSEAAGYPLVTGTAVGSLKAAEIKEGDKVLIIGGSTSVGRMAIQLCKNVYNTSEIVSICSTDSADEVSKLGSKIVDYKKVSSLLSAVQDVAVERKFDAIIDCVGNSDFFSDMNSVLKNNGAYVSIVGDSVLEYGNTNVVSLMKGFLGVFPRYFRSYFNTLGYRYIQHNLKGHDWIPIAFKAIEEGKIKVKIDSQFAFEDFEKAVVKLEDHKAKGKIIVNI